MRIFAQDRAFCRKHNRRHPDKPLCLAALGRIVQWGLETGRIKPCSFWCEGRAKHGTSPFVQAHFGIGIDSPGREFEAAHLGFAKAEKALK